jgi:hypothetical protein
LIQSFTLLFLHHRNASATAKAAGVLGLAAKGTFASTDVFASGLFVAGASAVTATGGGLYALSVSSKGTRGRHFILYAKKKI